MIRQVSLQCLPGRGETREALHIQILLLGAVCFDVLLGSMLSMIGGMDVMGMRQMRMMGRFLVIARLVVPGSFVVMTRSVLMVLSCLFVMMGCFL